MKPKALIGALAVAGVIGTGAAVWNGQLAGPVNDAYAAPANAAAIASPAANPAATTLPLNGFSELVKRYGPAVVNVSVEGTRKVSASGPEARGFPGIPGLEGHPGLRDFFRDFGGGVPGMPPGAIPSRGQGSGFIVSDDGYIITNAHVVENADVVTVRLTDRREYRAKVVGTDKPTDVAVLKIEADSLPTVKLGKSSDAQVGEWVVAIGSPFGFENSVSAGIVSAKSRSLPDANYTQFLQTDVAVNPGNSGGPLFNLAGEVIGINSQIYSRTGGFQGISFAIPIETAVNVKNQILEHGKVSRPRIGVTVQEVNAALAESFGLDRPRGALVSQVEPGMPGEKAGLKAGDIILRYGDKAIERSGELPVLVSATKPGDEVKVEVWRNGSAKSLTVATTEAATIVAGAGEEPGAKAAGGRLGLAVRPLTPQERSQQEVRNGVVVEQVSGPAARAGVQPGDVVLSFNGAAVESVETLREQVARAGKNAALLIKREGRQLFVPVELG